VPLPSYNHWESDVDNGCHIHTGSCDCFAPLPKPAKKRGNVKREQSVTATFTGPVTVGDLRDALDAAPEDARVSIESYAEQPLGSYTTLTCRWEV
jgi:hypothetical protein